MDNDVLIPVRTSLLMIHAKDVEELMDDDI